jgi:hypothetical protein
MYHPPSGEKQKKGKGNVATAVENNNNKGLKDGNNNNDIKA